MQGFGWARGCVSSVRTLVGDVVKPGPIMSWCQSFVLVRFRNDPCEVFLRGDHMAAANMHFLDRGRLKQSSPGRALFSNDEGAAPFIARG